MMTIIRFAAAVTVAPATGSFDYAESGWIRSAAHGAVSQVCIERKPFAAVTGNAAKCFHWIRCADRWQIRMAGEAVFRFT
jgi:hypothetical protein